MVDIGIEHEKGVAVPEGGEELPLSLDDSLIVETVRKPGRGVRVEEPADRVRPMAAESLHRVHRISLRLRHLLPVLILNMAENQDIFIGRPVEEDRGLRKERVEPSPRLIHRLTDELRRKLGGEELLVLKRIVMLRIGHRAGIKPAVNDLRHPFHPPAAVRAAALDLIHIGLMELDVLIAHIVRGIALLSLRLELREALLIIRAFLHELPDRSDRVLVSAGFALPDI